MPQRHLLHPPSPRLQPPFHRLPPPMELWHLLQPLLHLLQPPLQARPPPGAPLNSAAQASGSLTSAPKSLPRSCTVEVRCCGLGADASCSEKWSAKSTQHAEPDAHGRARQNARNRIPISQVSSRCRTHSGGPRRRPRLDGPPPRRCGRRRPTWLECHSGRQHRSGRPAGTRPRRTRRQSSSTS